MEQRLPLPPFTMETALQKVQLAEDAWNSKDPERVCLAYTIDTEWRNRTDFINGREAVKEFLKGKWERELNYKLKKELWGFRENRMAVRFEYEFQNADGQYRVKALTEIADFNEVIGTDLSDEEFSTIGGLVVHQFGHLPKRGDEITLSGIRFKVLRADSRRLHTMMVEVLPELAELA